MAGALIGALRVSLSAETSAFEQGMKRSQKQAAQTAGYIRTKFGNVGVSLKESLAGLVAGLTLGAAISAGKAALEYAGHLGELADTLGLTTKDLQEFSYAAGQVGISQEELQTGIQKLTISMGQAELGAKKQTVAFNAIGISLADLKGKNAGEVFRLIADKLQNVSDRSQRAAVEVALFGKAGAKLDNLLSGAQGSLNGLSAAAEKLGIVLSDEQIRKADETADKLEALKTVLKAQIARVVSDNAGAVLELANSFEELAGKVARALGQFAQFASWLNRNADPIRQFIASITPDQGLLFTVGGNKPQTMPGGYRPGLQHGTPRFSSPVNVGKFLAPEHKERKAREDHTAEKLARQAYEFQKQQLQAEADILQARQDLSSDYSEQASLQIDILNNQRDQYKADLAYQVKTYQLSKGLDGITQAQADQQLAQYDIADSLKRQKVIQDEIEQRQRDVQELTQHDFDRRRETLEKLADLATTAGERRKIELELLKLAYEQKRQALQDIIDHSKNIKDQEDARRDLLTLNRNYALDRQGVMNSTRNPLEEWAASIPKTKEEIIAAMQEIEARGIDELADSLTEVLMGTKSLKDAFHDLAASILADLLKMTVKMLLFKAIEAAMGGGTSGFSGGGSISVGSVPGYATGGSIIVGGRSGTDKNLLSLNGLPIGRVSMGERINISNDNDAGWGGMGFSVTMHNDFRGADPSSVARIQNHLDQLEQSLPSRIVSTMNDARDRFLWRSK